MFCIIITEWGEETDAGKPTQCDAAEVAIKKLEAIKKRSASATASKK